MVITLLARFLPVPFVVARFARVRAAALRGVLFVLSSAVAVAGCRVGFCFSQFLGRGK